MAKSQAPLNITVLSGGPDAEAMISRKSAAAISNALRTAGHHVHELDLPADDPSSPLHQIPQDHVVFPALHGPWGEGGGAQLQLVELGLPFVGFGPAAAIGGHGQTPDQSPGVRTWRGDRHWLGGPPRQPPTLPRPLRDETIG